MSNWLLVWWFGCIIFASIYFLVSYLFKVAEGKKHPEIAFIKKEIKNNKWFINYLDKEIAQYKFQIKTFETEAIVERAKEKVKFHTETKEETLIKVINLEKQLKKLTSKKSHSL